MTGRTLIVHHANHLWAYCAGSCLCRCLVRRRYIAWYSKYLKPISKSSPQ